ncbi:MAG: hypothetical protein K9H26_04655 [Prolixibacteraceae bacterium]|nr:hypothetical protein [Prolixibacteraceae bacterium]
MPWKFVPTGSAGKVALTFTESDPDYSKFSFVTSNGIQLLPDASGGTPLLTLPAGEAGSDYHLYALYNGEDGTTQVGRLHVRTEREVTYPVTLVPMAAGISTVGLADELNRIYAPYAVKWQVTEDNALVGNTDWDVTGTPGQINTGDAFLSEYSDDQISLHSYYKEFGTNYDASRSYVFLFNNYPVSLEGEDNIDASTKLGDMPINRRWGYLFGVGSEDQTDLARTLAHELGHGRLTLRHTFADEICGGDPGATTNLMDYCLPEETHHDTLNRFQWEAAHKPALIGDVFQTDEDGAFKPGWYMARHDFTDTRECNGGEFIEEEFITYYAPSGLPFSLPKRVCHEQHSGKLKLSYETKFIEVPDKCLTSFRLDDVVYEALVVENEFIGYIPFPTGDIEAAFKDENTIPNLETIMLYDLTDSYVNRTHVYYSTLEGFEGDYYARGPIIEEDGDVLRCSKCQMPIEDCYCGRACVCYADHSQMSGTVNCHMLREFYGYKGIPFLSEGKLDRIEYFYKTVSGGLTDAQIFHNHMLNVQGLTLYYYKLGVEPPFTYQDVISQVGKLSEVLEMTIDDIPTKNIFKTLNTLNNRYEIFMSVSNINDALENEDYALAFYEAIKTIPEVGQIMEGLETILGIIYSESFMTALYNSANYQLDLLYSTGDIVRIQEMESLRDIAECQINRIRNENNEGIHNKICTCHK